MQRPGTTPKELAELPQQSGVYFFLNARGDILYVGKATNLRTRVRSYFAGDMLEKRGPLIDQMIGQIARIEWQTTDSALEALVLEAYLIKRHQPPHNTDGKSDKSFVYLVVTREEFPRLVIKRQREILEGKVKEPIRFSFGPFTSRHTLEQALKIIRRIFPFYSRSRSYDDTSNVYEQIGLAPGTNMNREEYERNIQHIKLFFEGKKKRVLQELEKQMQEYAENMEFEKAGEVKRRIYALNHIRDVALISDDTKHQRHDGIRIEAYDVAHTQGKYAVGVMTVLYDEEPDKKEYRKFRIKSFDGIDDNRALHELLERRFKHLEWELPDIIVADGSVAQKGTVERFLDTQELPEGKTIPVVACKKDEHHKVAEILGDSAVVRKHRRAILLSNSEAHRFAVDYHKQLRDKVPKTRTKKQ